MLLFIINFQYFFFTIKYFLFFFLSITIKYYLLLIMIKDYLSFLIISIIFFLNWILFIMMKQHSNTWVCFILKNIIHYLLFLIGNCYWLFECGYWRIDGADVGSGSKRRLRSRWLGVRTFWRSDWANVPDVGDLATFAPIVWQECVLYTVYLCQYKYIAHLFIIFLEFS